MSRVLQARAALSDFSDLTGGIPPKFLLQPRAGLSSAAEVAAAAGRAPAQSSAVSTSKTRGRLGWRSWRQLEEINLASLFPAPRGERFSLAVTEVLFLTYISQQR